MEYVRLENVWKEYASKKGRVQVLKGLNLSIEKGELVVILGPSGGGKTTLLRIISGLLKQDKGHVYLRGKLVDELPPKDRNVAMVFQNYAVYPFMSVFDNIAFPLKIAHEPKSKITEKVSEIARMLRIEELLDRKPNQLSGGQLQRVAIARALAKGADIILMDEPLANLDAQVRVFAREELKQLHKQLQTTIIYVTHDQTEAMSLASKVALLYDGAIQDYGEPLEVYNSPGNAWVASFIGNPPMNLFEAEVEDGWLVHREIRISIPESYSQVAKSLKRVVVGFRPESARLNEQGISAKVRMVERIGLYSILHIETSDLELRIITDPKSNFERGDIVSFSVESVVLFDAESKLNLLRVR